MFKSEAMHLQIHRHSAHIVSQDGDADRTLVVDPRMVDLCSEGHLRRRKDCQLVWTLTGNMQGVRLLQKDSRTEP